MATTPINNLMHQITTQQNVMMGLNLIPLSLPSIPKWPERLHEAPDQIGDVKGSSARILELLMKKKKWDFEGKKLWDHMLTELRIKLQLIRDKLVRSISPSRFGLSSIKLRKPKRKDTKAPQPSGPTTNVVDEAFTEENVSKHSNDPLLSGEDSMKLEELMELCTNLQQRVIDLESTKTTQGSEIASLKRRVKKLEKKNKSRTHKLKRLYKVGRSRRVESSEEESLGD
ncbi:hypothetical protein Tco_0226798 [Tanacetum coccineum]